MKSPKRKRAAVVVPATIDAVVPAVPGERSAPAPAPAPIKALPKASAAPAVALNSNCSVKDAAALKESLCAVVDVTADVVIDASAVERIDTATLQLLCAFVHERVTHDRRVEWRGTSHVLLDAAALLGVAKLLALPADGVAT